MRKLFALMGLMAFLSMPVAALANDMDNDMDARYGESTYGSNKYSNEDTSSATLCSYCWEKGEWTKENPGASRVMLFPVRVATGVVGAPIGALVGMGPGAANAVEATAKATFGNIPTTEYDKFTNVALTTLKTPILVPVGLVSTVVALPVGLTYGAAKGSVKGFAKGYMYPDSW